MSNSDNKCATRMLTEISLPETPEVSQLLYKLHIFSKIQKKCNEAVEYIQTALEKNDGWIQLQKDTWYFATIHGVLPGKTFEEKDHKAFTYHNFPSGSFQGDFSGFKGTPLFLAEAQKLLQAKKCPIRPEGNWIISCKRLGDKSCLLEEYWSKNNFDCDIYCFGNGSYRNFNGSDQWYAAKTPVFRLGYFMHTEQPEASDIVVAFIDNKLSLSDNKLHKIFSFLAKYKEAIVSIKGELLVKEELLDKGYPVTINIPEKSYFECLQELLESHEGVDEQILKKLKQNLLECDNERFALDPYDDKLLVDNGRGHWELWEKFPENSSKIKLGKGQWLVARDPVADVHNGVVAIDFGTKSTVVVRLEEYECQPMRVGMGQLRKKAENRHYENPTVMEFIDLAGFLDAYNAREGRPFTKWSQITISHSAAEALLGSVSEDYYAYLSELKQWAGDNARTLCVMDKQKYRIELPPYESLVDEEFDPIEVYAYYLGLNINNMVQGISLDYVLSFPVTYEKVIQDKILSSFKRGLRKSLPVSLLNNKEAMYEFSVTAGASEPAAYAICALKQYGFTPKGGEKIAFGVFDFGGGTTVSVHSAH